MNGKIGMQAFSMLLAVLLVSVMMVSVVSAGENRTTSLVEGPEPSIASRNISVSKMCKTLDTHGGFQ
jgi:hypothetical protein